MPLPRLLGGLLSCRLLGWLPAFSRSPLEREMAAHSRNLAWKNPTDRGAWQATVRGAARVRHDLATKPSQGSVQSWACPSVYSMLINSALVSMRAQVQSSRNDFLSLCRSAWELRELESGYVFMRNSLGSYFILFYYFSPCSMACGIWVRQPGIEPLPPAAEAQSLNHWSSKEVASLGCYWMSL